MNKFLLTAIIALSLFSCNQNSGSEEKNQENTSKESKITDKSSIVNTTDSNSIQKNVNPEDSVRVHIFKKGQTLWKLAESYYGNRHYSSIISAFNNIKDPANIKAGTIIQVPPLEQLFNMSNPDTLKYGQPISQLLNARSAFMDIEEDLWNLRRKTAFKGKQNLSGKVKEKLLFTSALIDSAKTSLLSSLPDKKVAAKVNRQLNAVTTNLNQLAQGSNDGYGYDLDMVHQNMINAMEYLLVYFKSEK